MLSQPCSERFQPILTQLRRTFAFLQFSQRSAINPERFRDVSIPPWFERGAQQDCEEMLRHLLVKLQEEFANPSICSMDEPPSKRSHSLSGDSSSDSGRSSVCSTSSSDGRSTRRSTPKRRNFPAATRKSDVVNPVAESPNNLPSISAGAAVYWLRTRNSVGEKKGEDSSKSPQVRSPAARRSALQMETETGQENGQIIDRVSRISFEEISAVSLTLGGENECDIILNFFNLCVGEMLRK